MLNIYAFGVNYRTEELILHITLILAAVMDVHLCLSMAIMEGLAVYHIESDGNFTAEQSSLEKMGLMV